MDCSKTETFFNEWHRMCNTVEKCNKCPLGLARGYDVVCETWIFSHNNFKEALEIVQEWSDQHPVKTRLSVLREAFPNAKYESADVPEACAGDLFGFNNCREDERTNSGCYTCWNTPIEGV